VNGVYFDVSVSDRPDGRSVSIHLFYSSPKGLKPVQYVLLKEFLVVANRLYQISSRTPEVGATDDVG